MAVNLGFLWRLLYWIRLKKPNSKDWSAYVSVAAAEIRV
jgi:hypothetical protein